MPAFERKIRFVYIASPYTKPDPATNVRKAIDAAEELVSQGFQPYVAHLLHLWHIVSPQEYRYWMDMGLAWLGKCDAVLRLHGDSPGADIEEEKAKELKIPVFHSILELMRYEGLVK